MKPSASRRRIVILALLAGAAKADAVEVTVGFDKLPSPPAVDSSTGLYFANDQSQVYDGITWDTRFGVAGKDYRVNPLTNPPPNPLFGLPHSGHYYSTNAQGDDGLLITTTWLLKGAWFGRNEYDGYSLPGQGGGADRITIVALAGGTTLGSVVFDLPDPNTGLPDPLSFVDTSSFASLTGITGYRIDRRAQGPGMEHWIADDFVFETAQPGSITEPGSLALTGAGIMAWLIRAWRGRFGYQAA